MICNCSGLIATSLLFIFTFLLFIFSATTARRQKVPRSFFDVLYSPFGEIWLTTNARIFYRGGVEKIEFAQRFMKKMLRLLGANRHFLIPYFYFLIIYFRLSLCMRYRQLHLPKSHFYPELSGQAILHSIFYIPLSFSKKFAREFYSPKFTKIFSNFKSYLYGTRTVFFSRIPRQQSV